ncbi:transmembrane protein 45A-like [Microtus oregoni]|uniref:transmembrane protein 45A-like n=1 Tax=Microtus oregoni TaxID=111838 RepID=UPI001BB2B4F5|nr:transmembrane protein 45A-like [Microtus oregoni]
MTMQQSILHTGQMLVTSQSSQASQPPNPYQEDLGEGKMMMLGEESDEVEAMLMDLYQQTPGILIGTEISHDSEEPFSEYFSSLYYWILHLTLKQNLCNTVMGDFPGHVLPGTLFFVISLWWSIKHILEHVCRQQKRSFSLITKEFFFRAEIVEGIVITGVVLVGIIGLYLALGKRNQLSDKESQLVLILHWHHLAMYVFFALLGGTKILCFIIRSLPVSLVKLMLANACFVDAFIFHNHTHGRTLVDTFGHQLLSFAIFLAGLVAFIELFTKNNVVLALLRSSFVMLHGMWFFQVAFVLFPRNKDHAWDLSDHSNVLFFTVCFCLYYALTYVIIGINYALVTWLVKWRLSKLCTSETQLLKNLEQQEESEDEM